MKDRLNFYILIGIVISTIGLWLPSILRLITKSSREEKYREIQQIMQQRKDEEPLVRAELLRKIISGKEFDKKTFTRHSSYSVYKNVCWSCHWGIDSDINQRCPVCGWYICSHCGHCSKDCSIYENAYEIIRPEYLELIQKKAYEEKEEMLLKLESMKQEKLEEQHLIEKEKTEEYQRIEELNKIEEQLNNQLYNNLINATESQKVMHKHFGIGKVISVKNEKIEINFENFGMKLLYIPILSIELIEFVKEDT